METCNREGEQKRTQSTIAAVAATVLSRAFSESTTAKERAAAASTSVLACAHAQSATSSAPAPGALARRVAIAAINRAIATRLKRHGRRLATTRTNHRCSLRRSRTVAGSPLIGLFCLTARLTTLWCRVTAFLKKLLIGRAEGKFLPTVAARNLHVSGHKTPREGIVQPKPCFFCKESF